LKGLSLGLEVIEGSAKIMDNLTDTSETKIQLAMIRLMLNRIEKKIKTVSKFKGLFLHLHSLS